MSLSYPNLILFCSLLGNLLFAEGGPVREGFDEEIGQEGGLTAIAGPAVRFDNGGGTTEEMLKKRRALQGGWENNPAFTISTLRRNKASINRKIDDIKEFIYNLNGSIDQSIIFFLLLSLTIIFFLLRFSAILFA